MELAQTQFAFDPGMAELDDPAAAAILLLRLGRGHLAAEGDHGLGLYGAQQAAATMLIAGTALRLQRTALTVLGPGLVAKNQVSQLAFVPSCVAQVLVSWTNIVVLLGVIDENFAGEASGAGAVFLVAAFAQAADIIHSQLRHGFDAAAIGVTAIGQHLLRLVSQAGSDALDRRRQLFAVIAGLSHFHVYDQ